MSSDLVAQCSSWQKEHILSSQFLAVEFFTLSLQNKKMFFNSPGGSMDFTNDSFNFRARDNDFRLNKNKEDEANYWYEEEESESTASDTSDGSIHCYQYNRKRSLNSDPLPSKFVGLSERMRDKASKNVVGYSSTASSEGQSSSVNLDASALQKVNTKVRFALLDLRPCPGVPTCPMIKKTKKKPDCK